MQDRPASAEAYERFIQEVLESDEVYGLCSPDEEWAVSPSQDDEELDVLLVWSDKASAARHQKGEWEGYKPTAIPLEEFVDFWLNGMHEDGVLVGPNWDAELGGLECEAREVAERLTE
jgi:Protein of unknown function (DUF2750)